MSEIIKDVIEFNGLRVIYYGGRDNFKSRTMIVNGVLHEVYPMCFRRDNFKENTVEFSLTPFI